MTQPTRVYIAGPMSGLPGLNHAAFNAAAAALRGAGFDAVNPVDLNPPPPANLDSLDEHQRLQLWRQCMRRDLAAMLGCDVVVLLTGWTRSRGAWLEQELAEKLGIPAWPYSEFMQERKAA